MKQIAIFLILWAMSAVSYACDGCQQDRLSEEEFRARQREYITEHAQLTEAEAEKFFPLYFELQDKKKELNEKTRQLNRRGKAEALTDAQYIELLEQINQNRILADQLDMEYLKRFSEVLTGKKIFLVQQAEMSFHMDMVKGMRPRRDGGERPQRPM